MDERWKLFELRLQYFDSVGRHQSFYVNLLVTVLAAVWLLRLSEVGAELTVQVAGMSVRASNFWTGVPFVLTLLVLPLVGTANIIHHAWRLVDRTITEIGTPVFFAELDHHKNILDYIGYLTPRLRRPPLPESAAAPNANNQTMNFSLLLYPGLILFSIYTTAYSAPLFAKSYRGVLYVISCILLQSIFSVPFLWRKACLFLGAHKNAYEGMNWTDGTSTKIAGTIPEQDSVGRGSSARE